jgi:FdhD protein
LLASKDVNVKPDDLPQTPLGGARAADVHAWRAGRLSHHHDWVAEEVPVAMVYNGISQAVMLATPSDLEDFALGFSLTEGLVQSPGQIYAIESTKSCDQASPGITLAIQIAARCEMHLKERRRTLAGRTGCGLCGTDQLSEAVRPPAKVTSPARFERAAVSSALAQLKSGQHLLGLTGATHAAAWCNAQGDIALLREDVGRHNALDKLIGALVRSPHTAHEGFVVVTSRASYEMVHKTAHAGVPLLAAVSGVTGLAIDMAQQAGLTLVGFARGQDLSIYSHPQRLPLGETSSL